MSIIATILLILSALCTVYLTQSIKAYDQRLVSARLARRELQRRGSEFNFN